MNELEEKKAQANKLLGEIRAFEEKQRIEVEFPEMKKWEGTYWKYQNCYSSPQSPEDYWWLHRYVWNVTADGYMDLMEFQIDKDGKLDVRFKPQEPWMMMRGNWIKSSPEEWREAAQAAKVIVDRLFVKL